MGAGGGSRVKIGVQAECTTLEGVLGEIRGKEDEDGISIKRGDISWSLKCKDQEIQTCSSNQRQFLLDPEFELEI